MLAGGDITKGDAILWGHTPTECIPYLKHREREVLFREAVLAFLGVPAGEGSKAVKQKTGQGIGEFCNGRDVEECGRYFGQGLPSVCATCPQ